MRKDIAMQELLGIALWLNQKQVNNNNELDDGVQKDFLDKLVGLISLVQAQIITKGGSYF
ncbi:MAG TPA: hypothetical protein PK728_05575 [Bacillota bacterium]|nr:hypothetical protein [Bacillota bacterium]